MRRMHLWGGAALLALVSALFVVVLQSGERAVEVPEAPAAKTPDLAGTWQLDWAATTRQSVGRTPTESRVTLAATVSLTPLADGRHALRFETVDALQMHVAGADTPVPGDALTGHVFVFLRAASGAPTRFWTPSNTPPGFAHLATAVARRLTALRADTTRETTPLGDTELRFDGSTRTRTYLALHGVKAGDIRGESHATVDADHIEDVETITAGNFQAQVRFTARRVGPAGAPPRVETLVEHRPDQPSSGARRHHLEAQAGTLDRQQLLDGLKGFAAAGSSPTPEWIWRAVGRLRLNPELAGELGALLPTLSPFGRALVADLLASAGHPEAQSALCEAFNDSRLVAAPVQRARLLQRLGFVDAPTAETAAFVESMAQSDDVRMRRAAHLTRGGLARRMDDPGPILDALTTAVGAEDPAEARAAIAGLGNTAHPDAAPTILEQTGADDPEMRRTAAQALRAMPDVDATLVGMAADPVDTVQQAALAALNHRVPTPSMAAGLQAQVQSGGLGDAQRNQVVTLAERASREDAQSEAWRPVLEALLDRSKGDPRLAARVRRLLNRPRG